MDLGDLTGCRIVYILHVHALPFDFLSRTGAVVGVGYSFSVGIPQRGQSIQGIIGAFNSKTSCAVNLLGGFYSREQLKEVYGLQDQQYEEIIRHVFIDTSFLRRMNLNTVDRETLLMHPYLTAYQADAIIAYRDYSGDWKDIHEIMWNQLLPDSVFERIRPYLKIER